MKTQEMGVLIQISEYCKNERVVFEMKGNMMM